MISDKASVSQKKDAKESTSPAKDTTGTTKGKEIEVKLLVQGDVIFLSAGDMISADVRLITAKDIFLSQSTFTGKSLSAEKHVDLSDRNEKNLLERVNFCFMGTAVVSGSGTAMVVETGGHTYLASLAKTVSGSNPRTSFDKGVNGVTILLLRFMLIMAPLVFLINGLIKGNWGGVYIRFISGCGTCSRDVACDCHRKFGERGDRYI